MSDLVGNPEDRFSHNEAHGISTCTVTIRLKVSTTFCDFEAVNMTTVILEEICKIVLIFAPIIDSG